MYRPSRPHLPMHIMSYRTVRFTLLKLPFTTFLFAALFAAICMILFTAGCAVKREPVSGPVTPGGFVSSEGTPLDAKALAAVLARADYVLVGETHDNPLDHRAQAALLDALAASGRAPAVGLEMLPHGRFDAALRRFVAGDLSLDDLPRALDWQRSWGYDFALYRPVFEAAARHGLPVFGLNIDNGLRRAVSRKGLEGLTLAETKGLPLAIVAPLPAHEARLTAFFSEHSAMIGKVKETPGAGGQERQAPPVQKGVADGARRGAAPVITNPAIATLAFSGPGGAHQGAALAPAAAPSGREAKPGGHMRGARFLLIQSLWDSVMAEQAARVRRETGRPVAVFAGSGHVENGYGIAHRLRVYDPGAVAMTVVSFSGAVPQPGTATAYFYSPERKRFGLRFSDGTGSPVIESVLPGSTAEKAGLKAGDRVIGAGGEPVATARDLHRIAAAGGGGTPLTLDVERQGRRITVQLE